MTWPDTRESALARLVERIRTGAQELLASANATYDEAAAACCQQAAAGAAAYAEHLERLDRVSDGDLADAETVARAANLGGWISASTIDGIEPDRDTVDHLIANGVFVHCDAVPGRWVACYRLVDPGTRS